MPRRTKKEAKPAPPSSEEEGSDAGEEVDVEALQAQIEELNANVAEHAEKLDAKTKELKAAKRTVTALNKDLKSTVTASKKVQKALDIARENADHTVANSASLEKQLEDSKKWLGVAKDNVTSLKKELEEYQEISEGNLEAAHTEIEKLQDELEDSKKWLEGATDNVTSLKRYYEISEGNLEAAHIEIEKLQDELKAAGDRASDSLRHLETINEEKSTLDTQLSELRVVLRMEREELAIARNAVASAIARLASLEEASKKEIAASCTQIMELKEQLAKATADGNKESDALLFLQKENKSLRAAMRKMEVDMATYKREHTIADTEDRTVLMRRINALEAELHEVTANFTIVRSDLDTDVVVKAAAVCLPESSGFTSSAPLSTVAPSLTRSVTAGANTVVPKEKPQPSDQTLERARLASASVEPW